LGYQRSTSKIDHGNKPDCDPQDAAMRSRFAALWDSLNAERGYSFESNPWVFVISFRRI
jgi:hypothetical protein